MEMSRRNLLGRLASKKVLGAVGFFVVEGLKGLLGAGGLGFGAGASAEAAGRALRTGKRKGPLAGLRAPMRAGESNDGPPGSDSNSTAEDGGTPRDAPRVPYRP